MIVSKHMRYLVLSAAVALVGVGSAHAAQILDFEGAGSDGGEGLTNTGTTISTSFGVTTGKQALELMNTGPSFTLFNLGTLTGSAGGVNTTHYNAVNSGLTATGTPKYISFDISLDTTNVTTDGYFQLTLTLNSQNGYTNDGYGQLINGYNIKSGFSLGGNAAAEGATLTAITPFANGIGTYHFSEPLFAGTTSTAGYNGSQATLGNGGDGTTSSYYQISMGGSGGYAGTANFAIDNLQIGPAAATPEPASLGLIGLVGGAVLARRRKA